MLIASFAKASQYKQISNFFSEKYIIIYDFYSGLRIISPDFLQYLFLEINIISFYLSDNKNIRFLTHLTYIKLFDIRK